MSNLYNHAKRELDLLYPKGGEDKMEQEIIDNILSICKKFSEVGHSGFTAAWTRGVINKLLNFENITPLTDTPSDWKDISEYQDKPGWQNIRNSKCFSEDGGKTYWNIDNKKKKYYTSTATAQAAEGEGEYAK